METVYFNVLSRLSTDWSTKTSKFRFASKKKFLAKIDFSNFDYSFNEV